MRAVLGLLGIVVIAACDPPAEPVRLTVERTGCYGFCPQYKLNTDPSGRVVFRGPGYRDSETGLRLIPSAPESGSIVVSPAVAHAVFRAFESGWSRWRPNRFQVGRFSCPLPATDDPTVMVIRESKAR